MSLFVETSMQDFMEMAKRLPATSMKFSNGIISPNTLLIAWIVLAGLIAGLCALLRWK